MRVAELAEMASLLSAALVAAAAAVVAALAALHGPHLVDQALWNGVGRADDTAPSSAQLAVPSANSTALTAVLLRVLSPVAQ